MRRGHRTERLRRGVGLAFDSSYRHHENVGAATIGYDHTQCHAMTTRYTSHLVVEGLSGYQNGKIRQRGKLKQVYLPTDQRHECDIIPTLSGRVSHSWNDS